MNAAVGHRLTSPPATIFRIDKRSEGGLAALFELRAGTTYDAGNGERASVLEFIGDLDRFVCDRLVSDLALHDLDQMHLDRELTLVIDVTALRFIDSSGLRILEQLVSVMANMGRSVALHAPPRLLRRLIDVVGGFDSGLPAFSMCHVDGVAPAS